MWVCHCHGVNDDDIGAEIDAGARTVDEIGARCGAGTGCGGCRPVVEAVLATHLAHHEALRRDGRLVEHLGHAEVPAETAPEIPAEMPARPDPVRQESVFVRRRRA